MDNNNGDMQLVAACRPNKSGDCIYVLLQTARGYVYWMDGTSAGRVAKFWNPGAIIPPNQLMQPSKEGERAENGRV